MGDNGLTGGCQCGALRYRLDAHPKGAVLCHCRMCQKASGGPFMAFATVAGADFHITHGALAVFRSSEIAERGFCNGCGTPLTYRGLSSDNISVTLGSLDDPAAVAPTGQLGRDAAPPWLDAALKSQSFSLADWLKHKGIADVGSHQRPDHD